MECIKITNKKDLKDIFNKIKEDEIANKSKPIIKEEDNSCSYSFENSQYLFINNVTISFNKVQFDEDNLRFYIDDVAVGAIAILNIELISH